MRIYLDNCTLNRPFDDQTQIRIRLETEAKLYLQEKIRDGTLELVWSYILDYENIANPFEERRNTIQNWQVRASVDVDADLEILTKANTLRELGLRNKDALHLACSVAAKCDYFVTTDDEILRKTISFEEVKVINPLDFIRSIYHDNR